MISAEFQNARFTTAVKEWGGGGEEGGGVMLQPN